MVYTTMAHFEITLLNYGRDLINDGDFRDKLGIMAMKNIFTTEHKFGDVTGENSNEEHFYDEDFLTATGLSFSHLLKD